MTEASIDANSVGDEPPDSDAACRMKGPEYEVLVARLVQELARNSSLALCVIKSGSMNRIRGASGYKHQIDLSVLDQTRGRLFIVEAKCWSNVVGVEAVLVLASRKTDIQAFDPSIQVHASIVSTRRVTEGATLVAQYHGIGIDTVQSDAEYGLTFADQHFVGMVERVELADTIAAQVLRCCSSCGKHFAVEGDERQCANCLTGPSS